MSNVPPGVGNYLQRAGRAGRRSDGSSIVVTFARPRPFDREVFQRIGDYLAASLHRPVIFLDRRRVVRRHLCAFLLSQFFRQFYPTGITVGAMNAFGYMGRFCGVVLPPRWENQNRQKPPLGETEVINYGAAVNNIWWDQNTTSVAEAFMAFICWLTENSSSLSNDARSLLSETPLESEIQNWAALIGGVLDEFRSALQSWREDYEHLLAAWRETQNKAQANAIRYQLSSFYELTVIEALADRQFLPHYGFPIGVQKLRIITPDPDKRFHGRIREEDQYRLERSSLLALREYVPGSQLLVGGKLIASRGLLKHWTGATIDRSLGLRGKFTHCKNDHFHYWYDIGAGIPNCPICEAPPLENAWDLLMPKYGFTTAAWDPPRWSTDVERVGTTEIATITFSERSSGGTTFDVADFGGIDGLSVRYREDGELLVYNRGESGHGFAICLKCGYSQSESKHGQGAIGLPTGFDHHAPVTSASPWEDCWSKGGEVALRNQVLAARETTDVVLLDFSQCLGVSANDLALMTTITYALQRAGARLLELDARELGVMTVPAGLHGQSQGCVLFDATPGGAGHVRELLSLDRSWLLAAREAIFGNNEHDNHCETACLECLLSFDAQEAMSANLLRRRIALKALDALLSGPMQNRRVNDNPDLPPMSQASDNSEKRITRARERMQQRRH